MSETLKELLQEEPKSANGVARASFQGVLGVNGYAFGEQLLHSRRSKIDFTLARYALQNNAALLAHSSDENDKGTVRLLNSTFRQDDLAAYNESVEHEHRITDDQDVLEWLAGLDEATFVGFSEWNVARRDELQKKINGVSKELRDDALERTHLLVDAELFPPSALGAVVKATRYYKSFAVMDTFESALMNAMAYCGEYSIVFKNLFDDPKSQTGLDDVLKMTAFHEILHATGFVNHAGFMRPTENGTPMRWAEEAFVAHATSVTHSPSNPQIGVIDPGERVDWGESSYMPERNMMSVLLSSEFGDIPADLWGETFFSHGQDDKHRLLVEAKLKKAFSDITELNDGFELFNAAYDQAYVQHDLIRRNKLVMAASNDAFRLLGFEILDLSNEVAEEGLSAPFKFSDIIS